jgi:predicted metalloendopeptidase
MAPHFDWNAFFEAAGATKRLTNTQVIPETTLRQLDTLLRTTPLETMQLYLRYQYVNARARYLPQPFFEAYRDHFEAFRTDGTVPRDTFATEFVGELLPDDMLHVYVDRYQTPARKARLQSMVDNIKRAFERQIGASSWMAAQSRANALNTIRTMDVIIGAPDTRPDYSRLQIDRDSLFANVERAARYQHNLMLKKVDSPFDQKDIQIKPLDSAFYNSVHNVMFLPTDQTEGFDPQADDATAYAGVGVTIGHEIAHAFSGVRFPGVRGWTPADLHRYSNWTQTLVDQYSAHTPLPGHPIDGQRTLIENIADNLGLEATYDAYVNLRDIQVPDPADGLTRSQRFFFCYAQGQYRSQTDEELAYAIKYDPHTPGVVANNATVRNLPGFYQAFDVKHTDAMFLPPGRRARLW